MTDLRDFSMSFTTTFKDDEFMERFNSLSFARRTMSLTVAFTKPVWWRHLIKWWRFRRNFGRKAKTVTLTLPNAELTE